MLELGKRFGLFLVGNLVVSGIIYALKNMANGKDIFGRPKEAPEHTKVNWRGNIVLGKNDWQIT